MAKRLKKEKLPVKETQDREQVQKVTLEINTVKLEESIKQAVETVRYWYRQGVIRKVRLKYRGKAILPDIPLSYFMLVQVATFFLTGVVRALAINIGAKVFFEVEMINDAEEMFKRAKDLYLDGEMEDAEKLLQDVLLLDRNYTEAYLYLGIIAKVGKDSEKAREYFQRVQNLDPSGKFGKEASKNLKKMLAPPA